MWNCDLDLVALFNVNNSRLGGVNRCRLEIIYTQKTHTYYICKQNNLHPFQHHPAKYFLGRRRDSGMGTII